MSLVNELRQSLVTRARFSAPEIDALLALPELASATVTPQQKDLQSILRQSAEPDALQAAIGTFQRDLTRPAGFETEEEAQAAAAAAAAPAAAPTDEANKGLVDPPSTGTGD